MDLDSANFVAMGDDIRILYIKDFIKELEEALQIRLVCGRQAHVVTLYTEVPQFSLFIYLPVSGGRIPSAPHRTFHVDYDQLRRERKKICLRLAALLGKGGAVYARQTVAVRIEKKVAHAFLAEHHLQAPITGKYRYGLFHQGELVSIAVFSGGRHMRDKAETYRSFELLRFCHKSGLRVVGGLSKLISAFVSEFQPDDIMTYVDRDWSQESNLQTLGFENRGETAPQRYWITDEGRTAIKSEQHLHELMNMAPGGYLRSNCGSLKLVLPL